MPDPTDRVIADFKSAVRRGDAAALSALLDAEPVARENVNASLFDFDTPAVMAARQNPAVLDVLLAHGADINRKSTWWAGPWGVLDRADAATAEMLIARGATVDIFAASHLNRLDTVRELLDGDPSLIHAKGGDGCRPLHFAGSVEMVDLLLDRGAEIDARDLDHESTAAQWLLPRAGEPLDRVRRLAARGAAIDIFAAVVLDDAARVAALLDADPALFDVRVGGADVPLCPAAPGAHIYVYTLGRGQTPVDLAVTYGAKAVSDLLATRLTPRHRLLKACADGDRPAVLAMLRDDPDAVRSLKPADHDRLPVAAWDGKADAVALMLDVGFDPAAPGPDTGTALHCAAWRGRADVVGILLAHPAFRPELVHIADATHGSTPIGWCCHGSTQCHDGKGDHAAAAKLLLDAGAKPGSNLADASPAVRAVLGI